jgi:D-beta-D-heptose 7-phosphate kinase/D-beta-D-heptose 1-phosphate adenosyltransferase
MTQKIHPLDELQRIVQRLKKSGGKVVWTNGCFDILHTGHVSYLQEAKKLGDVLVVGLNSDASVTAIKGPGRPIVPEAQRAQVLAALSSVDYVVIFNDPTTVELLEALRPDTYVKGGDYTIDTINQDERAIVEGYGGKIVIIPPVPETSTSRIVERIMRGDQR